MVGEARQPETETGPLDGITVLDASRVLVGPFCTMQLGDLGADVIKIERPGTGDQTREWHPPTYGESDESAYYLSVNRNKRSMTLDLASDEGQTVFRDLASEADVVVSNFRVGTMEEWGLDYQTLREDNPGLVYCALSGYGEWGPDKDRPAYDLIMQAEGGLMSITGEADGSPVRVGVAIADIGAGMYATQAILAALLERELGDGTGQKVDVSLLDGQVAWMSYMASNYFATGTPPERMGSKHPTLAPYQAYPTADGYVVIAVPSPNLWPKFCRAIDREDLIDDERFRDNASRVENRDELDALLEPTFAEFTTAEIVETMDDHGVPATDVKDMQDVFDNPQVNARNMQWSVSHPTAGDVEMAGSPMHLSKTPTRVRAHPPLLGEHTEEILSEFGYTEADIERLSDEGVL
ncbi:crotonobetainyl-CoA:carnitine CoA-transferase /alpha-methylacyl-CoA racemase 1 [Haladaptatus paucihalophilus DX253]|uniref:CoA:oxalate CoA-transferase n=1 Tax=Haladaptatus paucihalophilus DX253 TaxID=797209 RepID=E7QZH7_HALPU|nr:CaiB/BaiF CoA-transferase family protein [Haladaptatus paucihalophilus]EFW90098.1 crotonobetainyl-CoA:carnitine CoA-transferase /alpha-methylacyl-CoA racemase 1 [Haladaptatus paucihalophilus DX253]SHL05305.1 CoA:oxalate CoA-transferase [Haladaptatus paucihalophilus DX253]